MLSRHHRTLSVPLTCILALVSALPVRWAAAREPAHAVCRDFGPTPVAVALSGGVSLGAHQAGFLYYSSLVMKANPDLFEPRVLTGSSAGGLNALLTLLSTCGEAIQSPTRSHLWRAWVELRTGDLIDRTGTNSKALLSRKGFATVVEAVRAEWQAGLPTSCDRIIGITATRLKPRRARMETELRFERLDEKFVLRIRGRGPGRPPLITNYVNPVGGGRQALLDLRRGDDAQNFDAFRDLLFATSAFPMAFAPQSLRYCLTDGSSPRWIHADHPLECRSDEVESAEFIDGGLTDNRPLGFASRLGRTSLETGVCGPARTREIPVSLSSAPSSQRDILYVLSDTGANAYPADRDDLSQNGLLSVLGTFAGGFVDAARSRDTVTALEDDPKLALQVAAARNRYPRMGEALFGFFGFFETDFRAFDFFVGMVEARDFFRDELASTLRLGGRAISGQLRLPKLPTDGDWLGFHCVDGVLRVGASDACRSLKNSNLQTLARLSLARRARLCSFGRKTGTDESHSDRAVCAGVKGNARGSDATDLDFSLAFLADNGFVYRDLGLEADEVADGGASIKSVSLGIIDSLADAQPFGEGLAVRAGLPVVLNAVANLPTRRYAILTTGPATRFGLSYLLSSPTYPPSLRLAAGAQIENTQGWFARDGGAVVVSPWFGVELETQSLRTSFVQTRLSLGTGYRFNPAIDGAGRGCLALRSGPLGCQGACLQAGFSSTILERLRLELLLESMPFQGRGVAPFQLLPGIGLQFYF